MNHAPGPTGDTKVASESPLPALLRTSVVGSYSVPDWLGRFKTDYHRGRLSAAGLNEILDVAIKAAIVDQVHAGVDIVSDGELRRDNDMDYLIERIPGIEIVGGPKHHYFDYYESVVRERLPEGAAVEAGDLASDFRFARGLTDRTVTVSLAGPFSLAKRIRNEAYGNERELVMALAHVLHSACAALVGAGVTHVQIDEPFLAGYPEAAHCAVQAVNVMTEGVAAHFALHVCYGNRYARPAWEGHYDFLFPAVIDAHVDELVLEFARKGLDDLELARRYPSNFEIGVGVVNVKSKEVEPVEVIEARLRQALQLVPAERIVVNPDCGLRHLPTAVARAKLSAMCEATANVRAEILGTNGRGERRRTPARGGAAQGVIDGAARAAIERAAAGGPVVAGGFDVVGVGNAIVDMIVEVGHDVIVELGLEHGAMTLVDDDTSERMTVAAGSTRGISGGSAANTVVGVVALGGSAGYIASVAGDPVGDVFVDDLRAAGVHFAAPSRAADGLGTGRCLVLVTPDGERTMGTFLGASTLLQPGHLDAGVLNRAKVVYLEGYLSDAPAGYDVLREAASMARAAGAEVALTLSDSFCAERHRELFLELGEQADIIFANESEMKLLSGSDDLDAALGLLGELGGVGVVTLGGQGSVVVAGGERIPVPAWPVRSVVDTTGAGDLYAAGFLFGWTHGADLEVCGTFGALAAGEVIAHLGARPERPLNELMVEVALHERLAEPPGGPPRRRAGAGQELGS
ncbi:MAG TPA: PfkB family carbohydrate kinase [Acidimicrobiales bacterium]|nr:PfkB family carbohydrate kinase [Acidimicrobiales bacterium]